MPSTIHGGQRAVLSCAIAWLLGAGASAQAQPADGVEVAPPSAHPEPVEMPPLAASIEDDARWRHPANQIWIELVSFIGDSDRAGSSSTLTGFSPAIRGRFVVADHLSIEGSLPFAAAFSSGDDSESRGAFRFGNPSASLSALFPLGRSGWFSVGLGLTAPLADTPDSGLGVATTAYLLSAYMRGDWNLWEIAPERFTLFLPAELELGTDRIRFGLQLAVAELFNVGSNARRNVSVVQVGGRVQGYVSRAFSVGARLRTFCDLSSDDDDRCQVSLEPFLEVTVDRYLFGLGWIMNVDEPAGPSSDLFIWGARLTFGARF